MSSEHSGTALSDCTPAAQPGPPAAAPSLPLQPAEFYRGVDGRIYHRPLPLRARIMRLRSRSGQLCNQAIWGLAGALALPCLPLVLIFGYDKSNWTYALDTLAVAAALLVLALVLCRRALRGAQARCMQQLRESQLALMVADDQFWLQIFELERDSPWLKWAQVTAPRSIEEHLLFAAAYYDALQWLLAHPGQLRPRLVTRGNYAWHAGRPWCYICAVLSCVLPLGWLLALPAYTTFAAGALLAKAGRLAALCDFFLSEQEPA